MSDTSSGSPRSTAKSSTKRAAKPRPEKSTRSKAASAPKGVLANLPRTRPQRSSARREAARQTAGAAAASTPAPARKPRSAAPAKANARPTTKARPKPRAAAKRVQDPAPRQGFETEGDPVSGPVQPPGSVDLLSSAAELAGELTRSGLASGGRLLKDFLTRLPLN